MSEPNAPRPRVTKTLSPGQSGTARQVRIYGKRLVCVRYRVDILGKTRYTTVEVIVEKVPVRKPTKAPRQVGVAILWTESSLIQLAKTLGAKLDAKTKLWNMSRSAADTVKLVRQASKSSSR
jgi:hypothetical protein